MKHSDKSQKELKETLFERIEMEHVVPRSRLFFRSRECVVWFLWFISVVVGALAVAVSLFVVFHRQYALYEATHDNFLTFMVAVLPYVWIAAFGVMVFAAVYNLRHTKRGYRYSLSTIVLSSVLVSIVGGVSLQLAGLGFAIDHHLGERMGMYMSQEKLERVMWQAPEQGRLLGRQVLPTVSPTTTVIFEDTSGARWRIAINELSERDMALLASAKEVRLLGTTTSSTLQHFHACGAFPMMVTREMTNEERNQERQRFVNRMAELQPTAVSAMATTSSTTDPLVEKRCATLALVQRMKKDVPAGAQ